MQGTPFLQHSPSQRGLTASLYEAPLGARMQDAFLLPCAVARQDTSAALLPEICKALVNSWSDALSVICITV